MNDFTKEELEEIKRCVKYMINGGTTPHSSFTIALKKKVQSMIENHCNHDLDIFCMQYCHRMYTHSTCKKCGYHP